MGRCVDTRSSGGGAAAGVERTPKCLLTFKFREVSVSLPFYRKAGGLI